MSKAAMKMFCLSTVALLALMTMARAQQASPTSPSDLASDSIVSYSGPVFFPSDPAKRPAYKAAWLLTQQAVGLTRRKDWDTAIPLFQKALTIYPDSPPAYGGLASAYAGAGRNDEAVATFRRLFYGWPGRDWSTGVEYWGDTPGQYSYMSDLEKSPNLLLRFALALEQTRQDREALAVYRQAVPFLPSDRGPLPSKFTDSAPSPALLEATTRTGLAIVDGDKNDALVQLQAATGLQPDLAAPYFYRGQILKNKTGRAEDALADFRRAEQLGGPAMKLFLEKGLSDGTGEFRAAVKKAQATDTP